MNTGGQEVQLPPQPFHSPKAVKSMGPKGPDVTQALGNRDRGHSSCRRNKRGGEPSKHIPVPPDGVKAELHPKRDLRASMVEAKNFFPGTISPPAEHKNAKERVSGKSPRFPGASPPRIGMFWPKR